MNPTYYYPVLTKVIQKHWLGTHRELINSLCGIVEDGKVSRMSETRFSRIIHGVYQGKKPPFTPKQRQVLTDLLERSEKYLFRKE